MTPTTTWERTVALELGVAIVLAPQGVSRLLVAAWVARAERRDAVSYWSDGDEHRATGAVRASGATDSADALPPALS